jgi:hypothetical protein
MAYDKYLGKRVHAMRNIKTKNLGQMTKDLEERKANKGGRTQRKKGEDREALWWT